MSTRVPMLLAAIASLFLSASALLIAWESLSRRPPHWRTHVVRMQDPERAWREGGACLSWGEVCCDQRHICVCEPDGNRLPAYCMTQEQREAAGIRDEEWR